MRKPLCVHIPCTLVTVRAICRALSQTPKIYLRWSSLLLTANYCTKQLHHHRCLWQSWIAHWKLYRKIETFLTILNEDNIDAMTHYLQTLNLEIIEHIGILKSYDYFQWQVSCNKNNLSRKMKLQNHLALATLTN